MRIAVVGFKGGAGKTTVAVALAEAGATTGPTLLVDTDAQGSASDWAELADKAGDSLSSDVLTLPVAKGSRTLADQLGNIALNQWKTVVIDTAPGEAEATAQAIDLADVAIVPLRPTLADMSRLWPVLDSVKDGGRPALVVLTQTRAGTRSLESTIAFLQTIDGVTLARTSFPFREAIAANYGRPPTQLLAMTGRDLLVQAEGMKL
jgi:chromosome partitioning protein